MSRRNKSHVSLGREICPVCLTEHDSGEILLDRRLLDRLEPRTVTGWGMCDGCEEKNAAGYVALIAVKPSAQLGDNPTLSDTAGHRTGEIAHLRRTAWPNIFDSEAPSVPFVWADPEVLSMLEEMSAEAAG
jgi:hypothetical protein